MFLAVFSLQRISIEGDATKIWGIFWYSALTTSMAENTMTVAPTREETIPKIVEDTAITTEDNSIVVYA